MAPASGFRCQRWNQGLTPALPLVAELAELTWLRGLLEECRLQCHFERAYTAIFRAPLCGLASKKASNLAVGPQSP